MAQIDELRTEMAGQASASGRAWAKHALECAECARRAPACHLGTRLRDAAYEAQYFLQAAWLADEPTDAFYA